MRVIDEPRRDESARADVILDDEADWPDEPEMPGPARVALGTAVFAGLLLAVVLLLRIAAPDVRKEQKVPVNHPPGPCWLCHVIDPKAKLVEVEE